MAEEEKAFQLSDDQREELRDAFTLFDKDGSGTISASYVDGARGGLPTAAMLTRRQLVIDD